MQIAFLWVAVVIAGLCFIVGIGLTVMEFVGRSERLRLWLRAHGGPVGKRVADRPAETALALSLVGIALLIITINQLLDVTKETMQPRAASIAAEPTEIGRLRTLPEAAPDTSVTVPPTQFQGSADSLALPKVYKGRALLTVTPSYLVGFYKRGLMGAEAERLWRPYRDKWMPVAFPIGDISEPMLGTIIVSPPHDFWDEDEIQLRLMFDEDPWGATLNSLHRGQHIVAVGQVFRVDEWSVTLNNCELVSFTR